MSIISPAKYSPFTSFDSMVLGSISFTETPPDVIIASSMGRKAAISSVTSLMRAPRRSLSSRVTELTRLSAGIPDSLTMTGISFAGSSFERELMISLFLYSSKSL